MKKELFIIVIMNICRVVKRLAFVVQDIGQVLNAYNYIRVMLYSSKIDYDHVASYVVYLIECNETNKTLCRLLLGYVRPRKRMFCLGVTALMLNI